MDEDLMTRLLVDPQSKRIVYAAYDGILPERITILEGARQYLFSPQTCEHVVHEGELPAGFGPQKCWQFRYRDNRIENLSDASGTSAPPVRRTAGAARS